MKMGSTTHDSAPYTASMVASALRLADRAVICDIETEGLKLGPGTGRCYDISSLLDPREHDGVFLDMAAEGLGYAIARGLIIVEQAQPLVVRIVAPEGAL